MAQRLKTDWILFSTVLAMAVLGVLLVYSASSIMAQMDQRYKSEWHFVARQAVWAVIALVVMMTLKKTYYRRLQTPSLPFSALTGALLLLGADFSVDTINHRWF